MAKDSYDWRRVSFRSLCSENFREIQRFNYNKIDIIQVYCIVPGTQGEVMKLITILLIVNIIGAPIYMAGRQTPRPNDPSAKHGWHLGPYRFAKSHWHLGWYNRHFGLGRDLIYICDIIIFLYKNICKQ